MEEKRYLTDAELDSILFVVCSAIPGNDKRVKDSIIGSTISQIREDLASCLVYPSIIPEIKNETIRQVVGSMIQPGDMVGVIAGQSIGQPVTQCTLSGFHKSGLVNITSTQGIPRITEIFNATHDPKTVNSFIYLEKEWVKEKELKDLRLWANRTFKTLEISDFVDRIQIFEYEKFMKTKIGRQSTWYDSFKELYCDKFENFDWCLRLYLDVSFLWAHRIPMKELARCIEEEFADAFIVWSPEYIGILDIYVDTTQVDQGDEREFVREVVKPEVFACSPSNFSGIDDVFARNSITEKEWVIDTNGSNLAKVLSVKEVDSTRTYSNELWEILNVLGIEATREFIIQEVQGILNAEGTGVCRVHLTILADSMCWRGLLSSVSRYGLQKEQAGPLSNASFEQCLDHLLSGAIYGEVESTDAVSSGIMCGTVTKVGTGMVDILHNMDSLLGNDIENGVDGYDMDLNDSDNDVDLVDEDSDRENTDEDIESEVDDEYDIADYI
jgi:DNA-directed RNA polymerase II subunit RPB1